MEDTSSYHFTVVNQQTFRRDDIRYELMMRQQPKQSRMCGVGEKADRRPIDPPPIVQVRVYSNDHHLTNYLQNPYFFMYATLVPPDSDDELHLLRDGKTRTTTGLNVSSLYHLKDMDNSDGGFFVFPDLSVRMEGSYRIKLSLFEIVGQTVYSCAHIFSDIFTVFTAKRFPGMEESTFLSRLFADQGLKIRIRKEIRSRNLRKQGRDTDDDQGGQNDCSSPATGFKRIRGNSTDSILSQRLESEEDISDDIENLKEDHNMISSIQSKENLKSSEVITNHQFYDSKMVKDSSSSSMSICGRRPRASTYAYISKSSDENRSRSHSFGYETNRQFHPNIPPPFHGTPIFNPFQGNEINSTLTATSMTTTKPTSFENNHASLTTTTKSMPITMSVTQPTRLPPITAIASNPMAYYPTYPFYSPAIYPATSTSKDTSAKQPLQQERQPHQQERQPHQQERQQQQQERQQQQQERHLQQQHQLLLQQQPSQQQQQGPPLHYYPYHHYTQSQQILPPHQHNSLPFHQITPPHQGPPHQGPPQGPPSGPPPQGPPSGPPPQGPPSHQGPPPHLGTPHNLVGISSHHPILPHHSSHIVPSHHLRQSTIIVPSGIPTSLPPFQDVVAHQYPPPPPTSAYYSSPEYFNSQSNGYPEKYPPPSSSSSGF